MGQLKVFLPLVAVEVYLASTLLLLAFGPVRFAIHDLYYFIFLMLAYHLYFCAGYVLAVKTHQNRCQKRKIENYFSKSFFNILAIFALFSVLNAYKNLTLSSSIIPWGIIESFQRGLSEPGLVYTERMVILQEREGSANRFFNIISVFYAFTKYLFIFYALNYWRFLSLFNKMVFSIFCFIFLAAGVSAGTNSAIFLFTFYASISIIVLSFLNKNRYRYLFLALCGFALLVPLYYFGFVMSQRGGAITYFSATSPLGDINVSDYASFNNGADLPFAYYTFVWLNYYLVQGYYGFSLILSQDWQFTFGAGNSAFLQRQVSLISGVDISSMTFQRKISDVWHESAQWHSFYGQFANDFGKVGLVGFMLSLGFVFGRVIASAIKDNSFYAKSLIPIFAIMFIFFPANNQIFGFIDTLSFIFMVGILWLREK